MDYFVGSVTLSAHNNTSRSDVELTEPKEEEWLNKSKPYCSKILVNIPYLRKNISILLVLSATALLLMSSSPLLLLNFLQPVQATSIGSSSSSSGDISFRTPTPATGNMFGSPDNDVKLTFDAQGTNLVTPKRLDTKGTYLITSKEEGTLYNGSVVYVQGCCLTNNSMGESIHLFSAIPINNGIAILTSCSTSATNHVDVYNGEKYIGAFQGPVECSPQGGNTTQQQSSSSVTRTTTTTQDRDRDGIPDANDNCPNLPNTRCYKEGGRAVVVHDNNR
ncbi:MAG: hypothetical protein ACJ703_05520 [Nitrososphaera sp.]